MPTERKTQIVNELKENLAKAKGLVLTGFEGLSVPEVEALRKNLSKANADYQVVKNTLLQLSLQNSKFQIPDSKLSGPTAVVLSYEDEVEPLKALYDFAKEHESFVIKGGLFEGVWLAAEKLKEIATLPGREALLARLAGMLQSPILRIVNVGKGNQTQLVTVLKEYREKISNVK